MSEGYWYLATPYKLYPEGPQAAYEAALRETAKLLSAGYLIYSPIVHNHNLVLVIPPVFENDFQFWVEHVDRPLMEGAGGLLVCCLPSWEESAGVEKEIEIFTAHNKPIFYYDPPAVPVLPQLGRPLEAVLAEELLWQNETFPHSTSKSRAEHLRREAEELAADPENGLEMADVLLLLSHLARGKNGPNVSLVESVVQKQQINRKRIWGEPDSTGVVEHVR